jgi:hemerythrin-like domain-containing protein
MDEGAGLVKGSVRDSAAGEPGHEKGTWILRDEHETIRSMLTVTGKVAARLERGIEVDPSLLGDLGAFFRLFVERSHHGKEEVVLFPFLEVKGVSRTEGPLSVLSMEHEDQRALLADLAKETEFYRRDPAGAGWRWARGARAYVAATEAHIQKENRMLFPMAERVLHDGEQRALDDALAAYERETTGPGLPERLLELVNLLQAQVSTL